MRSDILLLACVLLLQSAGCENTVEVNSIPIQFQSATGGQPQSVSVTVTTSRIAVSGGYLGAACGPVGAHAELDGETISLTVGTNQKSPCDGALVTYNYSAILFNIDPGTYSLRILHRRNGGEAAEIATLASLSVP